MTCSEYVTIQQTSGLFGIKLGTRSVFKASVPSVVPSRKDSASAFADQLEQQLTDLNDLNEVWSCTDISLVTRFQRIQAGFLKNALIWPNPRNLLESTVKQIYGTHGPYRYDLGRVFGALFRCRVEDGHLCSISYLCSGTKIWYIIPSKYRTALEEQL